MTVFDLRLDDLTARVSTRGGVLLGAWWMLDGHKIPFLRVGGDHATASEAACFPMVPFGNRVRGNAFTFQGRDITLTPNTGDPHYLHGDGWLADWTIEQRTVDAATLVFSKESKQATPYRYTARQDISLRDGALHLSLSVTNDGDLPLPFGLGWHPYFPLTPETTLKAPARHLRSEGEQWLPGEIVDCPDDLDFREARRLPRRWVNNGLEDWCGRADIAWPERGMALALDAGPTLRHAFVFISDASFDPAYRHDFFCFEPMSHRAGGHHLADLGSLSILGAGDTHFATLRLQPRRLQPVG